MIIYHLCISSEKIRWSRAVISFQVQTSYIIIRPDQLKIEISSPKRILYKCENHTYFD